MIHIFNWKFNSKIKWEINASFHPGDIDSEVKNDISYPWTNVILDVSNNWIQWKFCNVYVKMQLQFDFLLISYKIEIRRTILEILLHNQIFMLIDILMNS